jgi:hypothetical protein
MHSAEAERACLMIKSRGSYLEGSVFSSHVVKTDGCKQPGPTMSLFNEVVLNAGVMIGLECAIDHQHFE